jgi:hypothetical protein
MTAGDLAAVEFMDSVIVTGIAFDADAAGYDPAIMELRKNTIIY